VGGFLANSYGRDSCDSGGLLALEGRKLCLYHLFHSQLFPSDHFWRCDSEPERSSERAGDPALLGVSRGQLCFVGHQYVGLDLLSSLLAGPDPELLPD
jgi:hypothetical protein